MDAVRKILSEERLYHLDKIENPAENRGCFHIYDFFFAGNGRMASYNGADLEHIVGKAGYPNASYLFEVLGRLGEILIPEGVPAVCFVPGKKVTEAPVTPTGKRVTDTFVIYDLRGEKTFRMYGGPERNLRLERYAFLKRQDGTFALEVQTGWPGGTGHWDGAGNTFALPSEWFTCHYEQFLDKMIERYPAQMYGVRREELAGFPGLRNFLGFEKES